MDDDAGEPCCMLPARTAGELGLLDRGELPAPG